MITNYGCGSCSGYRKPQMSLARFYGYGRRGRRFAGFSDMDPADAAAINKALQYMDAALVEAQSLKDQNSGLWASIKANVTGVDVAAIQAEVDTFAKAAQSMHDTATRLLGDPNTTHDRVVDFVRGCANIANITALKDSANRNSLTKLLADVAAATVKDVQKDVLAPTVSLTKWLVVGAIAVGALVYAPEIKAMLGMAKRRTT